MNVLSLTYLGNVQYYSKLCFTECVIDIHEHYLKQSYRTRCDILTANGPAALSLQVVKPSNYDKSAVKDIRLDYSRRWQHRHRMSILSAYKSSPYFDHYATLFESFYTRRYDFLLDLNAGLTEVVAGLLGAAANIRFSESYIEPAEDICDLRDAISPKPRLAKPDPCFAAAPYYQVFRGKEDFVPNLSILDLLMCEGPGAVEVLKRSVKQS